MINSKQLLHDFVSKIKLPLEREELSAIGYVVLANVLGLTKTEILADKAVHVSRQTYEHLDDVAMRLNTNEPLQYILKTAEFYGREFYVDPAVLIPRPETEELVRHVIDSCRAQGLYSPRILDIGTGSGCIPITLALEIPSSKVLGLDMSLEALRVAERNAKGWNASVEFFKLDILSDKLAIKDLDVIVSNPPYIASEEKRDMLPNVTDFEPHIALFVDNHDPLVFYSAIATQASLSLKSGGFVAVEINSRFGVETKKLFDDAGFTNTRLEKDLSGKDRFVLAWKK